MTTSEASPLFESDSDNGNTYDSRERTVLEGEWRSYRKGTDSTKLYDSLQGFGNNYRTARDLDSVTRLLEDNDFHVFYGADETGRYTIPILLIRMQDGVVVEVRGVDVTTAPEDALSATAFAFLDLLTGSEEYVKTAKEQEVLTGAAIYQPRSYVEMLPMGYLSMGEAEQLARVFPEVIRYQTDSAFVAYRAVANQLGGEAERYFFSGEIATSKGKFDELFMTKEREWREAGVYDYLFEQFATYGTYYHLIATPNIEVSEGTVVELAETFAKQQAKTARIDTKLYGSDKRPRRKYTSAQLSGNSRSSPIRFGFLPSQLDPELQSKSVVGLKDILQRRQEAYPDLDIRVPSVLDAVTYWYTLRARGVKFDEGIQDATYIRHFNLPPVHDGSYFIPHSHLNDGGVPWLSQSGTGAGYGSRLILG